MPHSKTHLSLSIKITLGVFSLISMAVLSLSVAVYSIEGNRLRADARKDLEQAVNGLRQMMFQSVSHTIRGQLQATADRNREIVAYFYNEFKEGRLTEEVAREQATKVLLSQRIGTSGYIYVLDSTGTLRVHPKPELVNKDISVYGFIQDQMKRRNGYLEYMWANPGEETKRPKALGMSYFEPWDWIISASAYREEFLTMVNIRDFRRDVLKLKFGESGYAYVMDLKGNLLIHPELEGQNIFTATDADGRRFISDMCRYRNGYITYPWKNPGDPHPRSKEVVFRYSKELDAIIAGGLYTEELYRPLVEMRHQMLLIAGIVLLIALPLAFFTARRIGNPVVRMSQMATAIAERDLSHLRDFEKMITTEETGRTAFLRGSSETVRLLRAFRDAGASIRELLGQLGTNAVRLAEQRGMVESAANYSNGTVKEQSVMVSQLSSAVSELQATVSRTESMALEMQKASGQAVKRVADGGGAAIEAGRAMMGIETQSESTRQQIVQLAELTGQIEEVVLLVENIAAHSQILSVNASIEAAAAGTMGRGFSVVASEVHELAVQSGQLTGRIKEMLHRIRNSSDLAIRMTDQSSAGVVQGRQSIDRLTSLIQGVKQVIEINEGRAEQIARTVTEQSATLNQISTAVHQMQQHTSSGARNVDELLHAVDGMKATQDALANLASRYRV